MSCCTLHCGGQTCSLNKVKAFNVAKTPKGTTNRKASSLLHELVLPLANSASLGPPLPLLLSELLIAKGTVMSRTRT